MRRSGRSGQRSVAALQDGRDFVCAPIPAPDLHKRPGDDAGHVVKKTVPGKGDAQLLAAAADVDPEDYESMAAVLSLPWIPGCTDFRSRDRERTEEDIRDSVLEAAEIAVKYAGYIERERRIADKIKRLEDLRIPDGFDYSKLTALSMECRIKLDRYRPRTIAQASRISGVSPADISVLLVYFGR